MSKAKQFSQPGLPLTAPVFYILLSLSLGERHGYDILKHVRATSGDTVRLGPGTLYTVLKRLLDESLIVEIDPPPAVVSESTDERRRYYRLTERGRDVLTVELRRFEQALALARRGNVYGVTAQ